MRAFVVLVVLAGTSHADPGPVITTDALADADKVINLAVDVQVAHQLAVRGELATDLRNENSDRYFGEYHGGGEAAAALRVFFVRALAGPYVDCELRVRRFDVDTTYGTGIETTTVRDTYRAWSPRVLVGYQYIAAEHLSISAAVGIGYDIATRGDGQGNDDTVYLASIRAGFAF